MYTLQVHVRPTVCTLRQSNWAPQKLNRGVVRVETFVLMSAKYQFPLLENWKVILLAEGGVILLAEGGGSFHPRTAKRNNAEKYNSI